MRFPPRRPLFASTKQKEKIKRIMVIINIINKRRFLSKNVQKKLFKTAGNKNALKVRLVERFERHINEIKSRQFVHPIYRSFCKRRFCLNRLRIVSKTKKKRIFALALRIKRRAINLKTISRVPPFFCKKCGLASNYLHILSNHICLKKMAATFSEHTDIQKLIFLGAHSRVKDASAVLERIPNPQCVKLNSFSSSIHFELINNLHNPNTLMSIAHKTFEKLVMPQYRTIIKPQDDVLEYDLNFNECNNEIQCNETNFSNNFVKSNEEMCYSEDGVGYLCSVCNRLFVNYFLYDEHFERSKKCLNQALPDPIEIEIGRHNAFPRSGQIFPIVENESEDSFIKYSCTKCFNDFKSSVELHRHIFKCALI